LLLQPGVRLGAYEIVAPLGVGGMGEVYRATDTDLKRAVAVKVLPELVADDAERLARFQREAEVLAALNHPNIAHIHGLEKNAGVTALVMELVEGLTLADRIAKGPLPLDNALPIARQIAEALEAAHEQGIVHRDLKPANIKVRDDGTVKLLDFGLAKAMEPSGVSSAGASMSPTITSPAMTHAGVILGTAAYMSPEQATGKPVDKRADIWSFGVVLWEMLVGRRLFDGDTVSHTLADVLRAPIDPDRLPADTPPAIRRLVQRCLDRDVRKRLRDIGEARFEIDETLSGARTEAASAASTAVLPVRSRWRERIAWGTAAFALFAAGGIAWANRSAPAPPQIRVDIDTPSTADDISFALSPDGQKLVFVGATDGQTRLWLRSLDSVSTRPLDGTDGATYPFWSPDSRAIAFFAGNTLKRIDIAGGSSRTLTNSPPGRGGTWNRDGVIVFAPVDGTLRRVADTGGESTPVTSLGAGQSNHRFPHFLPDGRHFLFYVRGAPDAQGVYGASLDGLPMRRLLDADGAAAYASGHMFFIREGSLFAQPFDLARFELAGNPFFVASNVAVDSNGLGTGLAVSAVNSLAFRRRAAAVDRQLVWVDRSGVEIRRLGSPDTATPLHPELSGDGRQIAIQRSVNGNLDIWVLETARGILNPLTFDTAVDDYAVWSPDARHIVFQSNRKGAFNLYQKAATGGAAEELLFSTPSYKSPTDWSNDGNFVLFRMTNPETGYDVWALPVKSPTKPFPVVQTNAEERDAQFSPDGKWIAYQSNESGRFEIYVQGFPEPLDKLRISTTGGAQVRWSPNSSELFYVALDGHLMAVPIRFGAFNASISAGTPVRLFRPRIPGGAVPGVSRQQYDVSPDGRQFLVNMMAEEAIIPPLTLILNWKAAE
jgi:serine/threonine protein kinase